MDNSGMWTHAWSAGNDASRPTIPKQPWIPAITSSFSELLAAFLQPQGLGRTSWYKKRDIELVVIKNTRRFRLRNMAFFYQNCRTRWEK